MSREQAIIHYLVAMSVFKDWLGQGIISDQDLREIASMTADRYSLPKLSIYR